jgi:hypothetical protein
MTHFTHLTSRVLMVLLAGGHGLAKAEESSFYKKEPLFSTAPDVKKSLQSIARFGPVGIGIDLIHPVFTMRIKNVEEGSPAAATGKLKAGQIVETINGQSLKDIDPRIQLGKILAHAESTDGVIQFTIKGEVHPIIVKVPVLGSYSKTWPLNCAKSDKIVRQAADYIASPEGNKGLANIGMLFLLSTGEEKDLEVVRQWARTEPAHSYAWYLGYGGIPLTECYLRTGDSEILVNIQRWVESAVEGQYLDGWPGRNGTLTDYGGGHLNAAGTCSSPKSAGQRCPTTPCSVRCGISTVTPVGAITLTVTIAPIPALSTTVRTDCLLSQWPLPPPSRPMVRTRFTPGRETSVR